MAPKKKKAPASKRTVSKTGDRINIENQGERNVIAAGRHALAAVFNINIRELKWQPVVAVLVVVGALLGLILWYVIPRTSKVMRGQFNVAVAEFLVQDRDGRKVAGDDGRRLADYVADQIETQFKTIELDKTVPYEIWGPDRVGAIDGKTVEERKSRAAEVAEKAHAQVLIYGLIVADGARSKFLPEFHINHKEFWQASEIAGPLEMGSPLSLSLPVDESIPAIENRGLAGRVHALDLVTIGLAYSSVDDYQNAAQYFKRATEEERWIETSGKEVAYLLLGNAYVGWVSKEDDEQYLPEAERSYAEAVRINPDYGRARIGLANVRYLQSLGPLQDKKIDLEKLEQAAALAEEALALEGQPDSANIPAKAHFALGQIAYARYSAGLPGDDWLEKARQEFTFVTQKYEAGDPTLEVYAAHSYWRLGLIEYLQNRSEDSVDTSIDLVKKAISLAPPFYQGEYKMTLGNIYRLNGRKELARQAYEDALAIAESNGDAARAAEYQKALDELEP